MRVLATPAGRVNIVVDQASGQQRVGRFGWKCQQATLFTFSGDAYLNEMGITTPLFPAENCPQGKCGLLNNPALKPAPNDSDNSSLVEFTDFMTFLAPVPQGNFINQARFGGFVFREIGCINCQAPVLRTGSNGSAALNEVTFFPFSDFLLHDMGSLNDGIAQSGAGQNEIRTAPLWGCRLLTTFLHDGRANNLSDAILAHDGQGRDARNRFAGLNDDPKAALLAFLNAL
ncbi:MAG TPA: di-heme oxidoredictase family protein [Isosphaeraceae bacterium]|nr:di-heme oxidoredictase family protein [Isosphaeraceae bacterium]